MKVLFWTPAFWPDIGGIELISQRHILGLRERGHDFVVLASCGRVKAPDTARFEGVSVYRFPIASALRSRNMRQITDILRRIAGLRQSFAPDLEHLNFGGPAPVGYYYLQTSGSSPAPLIVALHGSLTGLKADPDSITGRILRRADWTTACSTAMLQDARRLVPEISARSSVVYYGLPEPEVEPEPLPFEMPRILCLGRLVEEKGFDLAIDAFAELARVFPRARLVIAGGGPARTALERRVARWRMEHAVQFTGEVDHGAVPGLINQATLVVIPSRWREALGLVAVEAAQMARPVVAARVGGLTEAVVDSQTGLLVEKESSRAIAEAISFLLKNPDIAQRMGRNGQALARDLFAWPGYLDAYAALYRDHGQENAG